MRVTLTEFVFPISGGERSVPHGVDLPSTATDPSWDAETLTLSYLVPQEEGEPQEASHTFTQAEIDDALVVSQTPPAPSVPQEVTPRQFRLAMIQAGVTPANIEAIIAAIPDETQRLLAETEWDYASSVKRDHPLVAQFGQALGKTDADIDAIFIAAKAIGG